MSVLVVIRKGYDRDEWIAELAGAGVQWSEFSGLPRHFSINSYTAATFPLKDHPAVEAIEDGDQPILPTAVQAITLDQLLQDGSWALPRIIRRRAPWNVDWIRHPISTYFRCVRDGAGVDIYIMDTGIATAHSEFGGRATNVYEFASSGGLGDDHGHGTSTASLAAGSTVGVARGSNVFSFKMSTSSAGSSSNTAMTTAIGELLTHYGGRSNPAVCSIAYAGFGSAVLSAIADMIDVGIVVVSSAGNDMVNLSTIDQYPGEAPDVICCGGIGMADIPYYRSVDGTNFGSEVSILAPAQQVRVAAAAILGVGEYRTFNGTSVAAPLVAGVVACMLQGHSRLTGRTQVQAVKVALLANATTGKLRSAFGLSPLPDKIVYLNPDQTAPEPISGL